MSKLSKEDNQKIVDVIDLFKDINPATPLMFGNKTQRLASWNLHKTYGDKVKSFIPFIGEYNARVKEFYHIKDPHSLLKNITRFFDVKRKYDADIKYQQEQKAKEEADRLEVERIKKEMEAVPLDIRQQRSQNIRNIILNS